MSATKRVFGRRVAGQRGFMLAEVLLALLILSVAILGLMATVSQGQRVAADSLRWAEAASLAQLKLDEAVVLAEEQMQPGNGAEGRFAWTQEFADKPHGLKRVEVEVGWSQRGEPQSFRLSRVFLPIRAPAGEEPQS